MAGAERSKEFSGMHNETRRISYSAPGYLVILGVALFAASIGAAEKSDLFGASMAFVGTILFCAGLIAQEDR